MIATGFTIRAQIIWAKSRLVIGRGDYHWMHEPCLYGVRKKGNWTGDRKQTTLWTIDSKGQDADTIHGTQKPVECMRRPMLNNSAKGDCVYDPFLGSGTTLIAAQTVDRICLGLELNPAYVDVIIRRWEAFTGERAELLQQAASEQAGSPELIGRSFAEVATMRLARSNPELSHSIEADRTASDTRETSDAQTFHKIPNTGGA